MARSFEGGILSGYFEQLIWYGLKTVENLKKLHFQERNSMIHLIHSFLSTTAESFIKYFFTIMDYEMYLWYHNKNS